MLVVLTWSFILQGVQQNQNEVEAVVPIAVQDTMFSFWSDPTDTIVFPAFEEPQVIAFEVTVTVYNATVAQCDADPSQLASGKRIKVEHAGSYRYCALSRNLLERWDGHFAYGDTIYLEGAGSLSGIWIVHDTMNSRFEDRIDLLVDLGTRPYKFDDGLIRKGV